MCLQNKEFLVVLFFILCGMLLTLLVGGRYFESLCDICLQFNLVANRKTE